MGRRSEVGDGQWGDREWIHPSRSIYILYIHIYVAYLVCLQWSVPCGEQVEGAVGGGTEGVEAKQLHGTLAKLGLTQQSTWKGGR